MSIKVTVSNSCTTTTAPLATTKRILHLTNTMTMMMGRIPLTTPTFLPTSSLSTLPSPPTLELPTDRRSRCKPLNRPLRGL
uniref:Uncharacterized protein n=1 Tax=Nelumbo nucifera TaxID=4432 RepID=A0A822XR35_NELNU|nr:TPA_asm: hypothetical protein HUJ06_022889 [Nelumbo nucifera]